MRFVKQVKSNSRGLPSDRFKISQSTCPSVTTIAKGVVFIFSAWSSDAVISFRALCEGLNRVPEIVIQVIVVDADRLDLVAFKGVFGELPHGEGEAYWIKNGQVIYRDHGYKKNTIGVLQARVIWMNSSAGGWQ